jgi:hypothetical protein
MRQTTPEPTEIKDLFRWNLYMRKDEVGLHACDLWLPVSRWHVLGLEGAHLSIYSLVVISPPPTSSCSIDHICPLPAPCDGQREMAWRSLRVWETIRLLLNPFTFYSEGLSGSPTIWLAFLRNKEMGCFGQQLLFWSSGRCICNLLLGHLPRICFHSSSSLSDPVFKRDTVIVM